MAAEVSTGAKPQLSPDELSYQRALIAQHQAAAAQAQALEGALGVWARYISQKYGLTSDAMVHEDGSFAPAAVTTEPSTPAGGPPAGH